jgi:hypothetical protein
MEVRREREENEFTFSRPWAALTARIVAEFAPMPARSNREPFAMIAHGV